MSFFNTLRLPHFCGAIALSLLPALLGSPAFATKVLPVGFSDMVKQSDTIAVGTAVDSFSRWEEGGRTIRTYVTFKQLMVIKGRIASDTYTLRMEGGTVGRESIVCSGMPRFERGKRYLLFTSGNGRTFSPITGFNQGAFEIAKVDGVEVLRNQGGFELIGIENDRFKFAMKAPSRTARASALTLVPVQGRVKHAHSAADVLEKEEARCGCKAHAFAKMAQRSGSCKAPLRPAGAPVETTKDRKSSSPIFVSSVNDRGERLSAAALIKLTVKVR